MVSICDNCTEIGYCERKSLKTYKFITLPQETYEVCESHYKSLRVK